MTADNTEEQVEFVRQVLRGERPPSDPLGGPTVILAALCREVMALHAKIRELQNDG